MPEKERLPLCESIEAEAIEVRRRYQKIVDLARDHSHQEGWKWDPIRGREDQAAKDVHLNALCALLVRKGEEPLCRAHACHVGHGALIG